MKFENIHGTDAVYYVYMKSLNVTRKYGKYDYPEKVIYRGGIHYRRRRVFPVSGYGVTGSDKRKEMRFREIIKAFGIKHVKTKQRF